MQPTSRPWSSWNGWADARRELLDRYQRRRVRLSLHDLADLRDLRDLKIDWSRLARPDITVYTPNQIRHLVRFDSTLQGRPGQTLVFPTVPGGSWLRDLPRDPAVPWRLPDFSILEKSVPRQSVEPRAGPGSGGGGGAGAGGHSLPWWEGAARGLPVGAVLLALLVLIVRMAEKCLDRNFFFFKTSRRRQSEEWPTPTVLATSSHRFANDSEFSPPRMDDSDTFPSESNHEAINNDLPPPYSECTNPNRRPAAKVIREEPPPPYSACYVAYSNPKHGTPSVHFFNSQRQNLFGNRLENGHSSRDPNVNDTGQSATASGSIAGCDANEGNANRNLVFENGRIVERDTVENIIETNSEVSAEQNQIAEGNPTGNGCNLEANHTPMSARDRFLLA